LHIRCEKLVDLDSFSKSDPLCAVYIQSHGSDWIEIGRTEKISDSLNPRFVTAIKMDYHFEELQKLSFRVYDVDNSSILENQDFIGEFSCALADIMCSSNEFHGKLMLPVKGESVKDRLAREEKTKDGRGHIYISAEKLNTSDSSISFDFSASNLDKKDFFGKSDPFLVFNQVLPSGQLVPVHKTEVIKVTLNPHWKKVNINLSTLCNCDLNRTIVIECYDWNRSGKMDFIGSTSVLASQLIDTTTFPKTFTLENEKKKKKGKNPSAGTLVLHYTEITKMYSFIEYLQGGTQIKLIVGIDFTGSNGAPTSPSSLHYFAPNQMNSYMEAIMSVGEILSCYDSDKLFPTFGFGGKLPDGTISHCFPLNGNPTNPTVLGVPGIFQAYQNALTSVKLWGPTNFAPLIRYAAEYAKAASMDPTKQTYVILLILTDGAITDMPETKNALVEAANTPLSIVITGIGNDNFDSMEVLDGDVQPIKNSQGVMISRDIVQFVPFNKFRGLHYSLLAQEVLFEIPSQLVQFYSSRKIKPLAAVSPIVNDVLKANESIVVPTAVPVSGMQ